MPQMSDGSLRILPFFLQFFPVLSSLSSPPWLWPYIFWTYNLKRRGGKACRIFSQAPFKTGSKTCSRKATCQGWWAGFFQLFILHAHFHTACAARPRPRTRWAFYPQLRTRVRSASLRVAASASLVSYLQ